MKLSAEEFVEIVRHLAEPSSAIKQKAQQSDEYYRQLEAAKVQMTTLHCALAETEDRCKRELAVLQQKYEVACKGEAEAITERNELRDQIAARRSK